MKCRQEVLEAFFQVKQRNKKCLFVLSFFGKCSPEHRSSATLQWSDVCFDVRVDVISMYPHDDSSFNRQKYFFAMTTMMMMMTMTMTMTMTMMMTTMTMMMMVMVTKTTFGYW